MGWVLFPVGSMRPFDVNVLQTLERSSLELKQVLLSLTAVRFRTAPLQRGILGDGAVETP
jgi:hypothetical protein